MSNCHCEGAKQSLLTPQSRLAEIASGYRHFNDSLDEQLIFEASRPYGLSPLGWK